MNIQYAQDPKAFAEFEHEGWEAISAGYQTHFTRLTSQSVPAALNAAGIAPGMRVLDLCTGPAMLARAAVEEGATVVGLDFSREAIEIARHNVPGAEFRQGDAQDLPFEDESFDAVVCGFGIIHLPDPGTALSEVYRVLRPGGRFAASVWEAPQPGNGFGLLFGAIKKHGNLDVPLPHGPDIFQFSDHERMTSALEQTGFREVRALTVEQVWEMDNAEDIVTAVMEGMVRARGLFLAQTDSARNAISKAVAEGMESYLDTDGGYRIPMPAIVGAGTK